MSHQGLNEERLIAHLFDGYQPLGRPVNQENDSLEVSFGLTLMQIINVVSNMAAAQRLLPVDESSAWMNPVHESGG